jgi:hypothetical protein
MDPERVAANFPAQFTVIAYPDSIVEEFGYGPEAAYIEYCWLPIIGPSGAWLWRRLARTAIEAGATPVQVDAVDLFVGIGLGEGLLRHSTGPRTISRLVAFDFARRAGRDGELLAVRTAVGSLPRHFVRRLPLTARLFHESSPLLTHPEDC